jgi:hypothetical protein
MRSKARATVMWSIPDFVDTSKTSASGRMQTCLFPTQTGRSTLSRPLTSQAFTY